jgi:hypothetical protein
MAPTAGCALLLFSLSSYPTSLPLPLLSDSSPSPTTPATHQLSPPLLLIKYKSYHVKKNELSRNALGENQLYWLEENYRALLVGNYSKESIRGYLSELRLLFHYYHEKNVEDIPQKDITQYIIFIKTVHGVVKNKASP